MFSIMTWRTHPTRQQLLVELRITGNTIQNMAWLFVNMSNQGANFAKEIGRGTLSVIHASTKMVLLNSIGISMKTMSKFRLSLFFGSEPRISFTKTLVMPA